MAEVGRAAVRDPGALLPGGFWAAVAVWLERPQVANKRLCGVRLEARRSVALPRAAAGPRPRSPGEGLGPGQTTGPARGTAIRGPGESQPRHGQRENRKEAAAVARLAGGFGPAGEAGVGESDSPASDLDSLWDAFFQSLDGGHPELLAFLSGPAAGSQPEAPSELSVVLRTLIPKTGPRCPLAVPRRELVVQDVLSGTVTFLPLEEDDGGNVKVETSNVYQIRLSQSQEEWFISILIFCPERWHSDGIVYPQPAWLGEELLARLARWSVESKKSGFKSTLSLISIIKYSKTYQMLKEKYKDMVKVWPEVTDPEKFVYEDVAIAAYLLILWEEERAELHLTAKQSFIDLGCGNGLLVHILSTEGHPGRGIDVRRRKIWDMYGPQTCLEVCLIGKSRTYPPAGEVSMDEQRTQYINSRRGHPVSPPSEVSLPPPPRATVGHAGHPDGQQALDTGAATGRAEIQNDQLWLSGFQPREKAERVRNCATLPRDFIDQVVLQVAHLLLEGEQLNTGSASSSSSKAWNRGGSLSLAEVARELAGETLQRLKRECGGLQTLLRNNHQVFEAPIGMAPLARSGLNPLRDVLMPHMEGRASLKASRPASCERESSHSRLERKEATEAAALGSKAKTLLGSFQDPHVLVLQSPPRWLCSAFGQLPVCPRASRAAAATDTQEEEASSVSCFCHVRGVHPGSLGDCRLCRFR
ncbi:probable tRNA (uracil-O(2)-)-methyltransferase isoform X5 [Neovison vison]|uniref:probable tRNA (uracil-O(2)-)-methyltransferase isoform X5 n=1 Tax=Neovison vison TaxID=452646 RepID=UPI001CF09AE0|nr:probable tRNA (uracil-O(2)-)-methyltransferase isoform X5 [Neogale vison]